MVELVDLYPKFVETMANLYFQKRITVSSVVVSKSCKQFLCIEHGIATNRPFGDVQFRNRRCPVLTFLTEINPRKMEAVSHILQRKISSTHSI